jgi:hypothetical protein
MTAADPFRPTSDDFICILSTFPPVLIVDDPPPLRPRPGGPSGYASASATLDYVSAPCSPWPHHAMTSLGTCSGDGRYDGTGGLSIALDTLDCECYIFPRVHV